MLRLNLTAPEKAALDTLLARGTARKGRKPELDSVELVRAVDGLLGAGTHAALVREGWKHGKPVLTVVERVETRVEVIAGALSRICRFGGHTSTFYSVAQHSVLVSRICDPADALVGLLHDAAEAYLGDLIRPLKRQPQFDGYASIETRLMRCVWQRFGVEQTGWHHQLPVSVQRADEVLLATEARDLLGNETLERWSSLRDIQPLAVMVEPWAPWQAEEVFLRRFRELVAKPTPCQHCGGQGAPGGCPDCGAAG